MNIFRESLDIFKYLSNVLKISICTFLLFLLFSTLSILETWN